MQRHSSTVCMHVRWVAIIADDDLTFDYKYNCYFIFVPFSAHNAITVEWASVWFMEPFDSHALVSSASRWQHYILLRQTLIVPISLLTIYYLSKSILHSDFRIIRMEQLKYTCEFAYDRLVDWRRNWAVNFHRCQKQRLGSRNSVFSVYWDVHCPKSITHTCCRHWWPFAGRHCVLELKSISDAIDCIVRYLF